MSEQNWIAEAGERGLEFTSNLKQIKKELEIGNETVKETLNMSLYYQSDGINIQNMKLLGEGGFSQAKGMYLGDVDILDPTQFKEVTVSNGIVDVHARFRGRPVSRMIWQQGQRTALESDDGLFVFATDLMEPTYCMQDQLFMEPASERKKDLEDLKGDDLDDIFPFGEDDV